MVNQTIKFMLFEQGAPMPQYPSATAADPNAGPANALDPNAVPPADPMAAMPPGDAGFGGDMGMGGGGEPVPGAEGAPEEGEEDAGDEEGEEDDGSEDSIPEDPYQGLVDKVKEKMKEDNTKNPNLLVNIAKSYLQKFGLLEPNKIQDAKSVVQKLRDENIPDLNNVADYLEKFLA